MIRLVTVNDQTLKQIVDEIAQTLTGRIVGKIFQLTRTSLAIDFRPFEGRYLFMSVEPSLVPRLYFIERRVKDLDKQSIQLQPFALVLRKELSGAKLVSIEKDDNDRIVRFLFKVQDEIGNKAERYLIAQLTGRAANLFLLNEQKFIIDSMRDTRGQGQQVGEAYAPPVSSIERSQKPSTGFEIGSHPSLSAALDDYYQAQENERTFNQRANAILSELQREIKRREKVSVNLKNDMATHGEAEEHKRVGDLLLANLSTAERNGDKVSVIDYFAEDAPRIEIDVSENSTLQEEATKRFNRYAKAKRAAQEIMRRVLEIENELVSLREKQMRLEDIIELKDADALDAFENKKQKPAQPAKRKESNVFTGARRYRSSDGYEILVGKASKDNDYLTFRVANSNDLWLHAGDYPGSHVIVRNPTRKEIPQRTILEAAQLAAQYSQAKKEAKAAVHYTERKFVSKPKGAAPGLVRLSSFRTLIVEPKESGERM